MASNTVLNPGAAGDVIATEDIGGVKYEQVKLIDSTVGSTAPIGTAANPLPISGNVGVLGAVEITNDVGNPIPVNGTVAVSNAFALEAGHLATIDTSTARIPAQGQALAAASMPVVLTAAQLTTLTPLTTLNLEATQALVKAKTDNLDVLLSTRLKAADTLAAVTSLTQFNGVAIALNTGLRAAGVLRVTQATDDVVHIDDNAGSITIDAPVGTPAFVRLSDGAAALIAQKTMALSVPVVLASDQSSIPVSATLAAASDPTKAEDAGHVTGDRGAFVLGVRNDLDAAQTSADLDYGAPALDSAGRVKTREGAQQIATTISAANATVTLTIAAAGAGLFHYITSVEIINVNPTATAIAGSAVTLAYTTTNIPGAPAWTAGNALAAGAEKVVERIVYPGGIKTTTANTATTFVAPAIGTGGLCRILVTYYIAP